MGAMISPTDEEFFNLAKIPANIDYYRAKAKYSEEMLAEELGISNSTYRRYMNEPRLMQTTIILRLCNALKISFDQLFGLGVPYKVTKIRQIVTQVVREFDQPVRENQPE